MVDQERELLESLFKERSKDEIERIVSEVQSQLPPGLTAHWRWGMLHVTGQVVTAAKVLKEDGVP